MSQGSSWQQFSNASAPERGAFPLDRDHICSKFVVEYLNCLKLNKRNHTPCRDLSRSYLECRMQNNLMETDEMKNLGFSTV